MTLTEKLQHLPSSPGIYLMKDAAGHLLYVGKAKNLKNRVSSYFQKSSSHTPKVKKLVKHLRDFELIRTDTEFEAFMLECQYIKEYKPPYNRKMKNPQTYTYVTISTVDGLLMVEPTNNPVSSANTLTFGPYTSRSTVERAVLGLMEYLKIHCSSPSKQQRACLNHALGLCSGGPCLGGELVKVHNRQVQRMIALLQGTDNRIMDELHEQMNEASLRFDFEAAARFRDQLQAIEALLHKEKVIGFAESNPWIAVLEPLSDDTAKLFLIKRSRVLWREVIPLNRNQQDQLVPMIRERILACFGEEKEAEPQEVTQDELDEVQIVYSYLQGSLCRSVIIAQQTLVSGHPSLDKEIQKLLV